jgi:hypothetical protein
MITGAAVAIEVVPTMGFSNSLTISRPMGIMQI